MDLEYRIIHSRRRTVSLIINQDGSLVVRAPKRIGKKEADRIIREKQAWIEKHLKKIKLRKQPGHEFADGENFLFLGQVFPLRLSNEYRSRLELRDNVFYLSRYKASQGEKLFTDWYARQAFAFIKQRANHFAELMGVKFRRISITSARTRWGSCSSGLTINFSWRLILAPPDIVDSVVVHELAHLTHHNHSGAFWAEVKKYYPEYKYANKWLRENGYKLRLK